MVIVDHIKFSRVLFFIFSRRRGRMECHSGSKFKVCVGVYWGLLWGGAVLHCIMCMFFAGVG